MAIVKPVNARPLLAAGVALGIGMGGFVDGILFHQILQLHNMLSNVIVRDSLVNEQVNMFWDGLFHAFTWLVTALAVWLLWHAVKRNDVPLVGRQYFGSALAGWGAFNLFEGLIDHQILQLHHVYESGDHFLWDTAFLISGVLLVSVGGILIRARRGLKSNGYRRFAV